MRGKEEEIRLQIALLWSASRFNPFFNIYMKLLEKIICWCGVMYFNMQMVHISILGLLGDVVYGVLIRENGLRHNPKKVEWLLMQRTIDFSCVPSMALDGVVLLRKSRLISGGPLRLMGPGELLWTFSWCTNFQVSVPLLETQCTEDCCSYLCSLSMSSL